MRLTWVVLGVVAAAGVIAFFSGTSADEGAGTAVAGGARSEVGAARSDAGPLDSLDTSLNILDTSDGTEAAEKRAHAIHVRLASAEAGGDNAQVAKLEAELSRGDLSQTLVAKRRAFQNGLRMLKAIPARRGEERIRYLDRTRRSLSAGVYLPEMFHKDGSSIPYRSKLLAKLAELNRVVMTYPQGLDGVTRPYEVPSGIAPVQIVSREKLPMGHNAVLYWHQNGNLDPSRLRAGAHLLLPTEELTLHVYQNYRRLGLYIGDWFVKEFRIGIGKDETPTPIGTFAVLNKQKNPDWTSTVNGRKKVIPFGDPRNELGAVWIKIRNDEYPDSGYGIHGTIAPKTVGTACSNGCVRLVNSQARELFYWVRSASYGGAATRIFIRYGPIPGVTQQAE